MIRGDHRNRCAAPNRAATSSAAASSSPGSTWAYTRNVTATSAWPRRCDSTLTATPRRQRGRGVAVSDVVQPDHREPGPLRDHVEPAGEHLWVRYSNRWGGEFAVATRAVMRTRHHVRCGCDHGRRAHRLCLRWSRRAPDDCATVFTNGASAPDDNTATCRNADGGGTLVVAVELDDGRVHRGRERLWLVDRHRPGGRRRGRLDRRDAGRGLRLTCQARPSAGRHGLREISSFGVSRGPGLAGYSVRASR